MQPGDVVVDLGSGSGKVCWIAAQMVGGLTSGLRAEAPGGVTVLVHAENLERAQSIVDGFWDSEDSDSDEQ